MARARKSAGKEQALVTSVTASVTTVLAHFGKTALTPLSRSRYTANTLKNRAKSDDSLA
jgi:hypothetical protein